MRLLRQSGRGPLSRMLSLQSSLLVWGKDSFSLSSDKFVIFQVSYCKSCFYKHIEHKEFADHLPHPYKSSSKKPQNYRMVRHFWHFAETMAIEKNFHNFTHFRIWFPVLAKMPSFLLLKMESLIIFMNMINSYAFRAWRQCCASRLPTTFHSCALCLASGCSSTRWPTEKGTPMDTMCLSWVF